MALIALLLSALLGVSLTQAQAQGRCPDDVNPQAFYQQASLIPQCQHPVDGSNMLQPSESRMDSLIELLMKYKQQQQSALLELNTLCNAIQTCKTALLNSLGFTPTPTPPPVGTLTRTNPSGVANPRSPCSAVNYINRMGLKLCIGNRANVENLLKESQQKHECSLTGLDPTNTLCNFPPTINVPIGYHGQLADTQKHVMATLMCRLRQTSTQINCLNERHMTATANLVEMAFTTLPNDYLDNMLQNYKPPTNTFTQRNNGIMLGAYTMQAIEKGPHVILCSDSTTPPSGLNPLSPNGPPLSPGLNPLLPIKQHGPEITVFFTTYIQINVVKPNPLHPTISKIRIRIADEWSNVIATYDATETSFPSDVTYTDRTNTRGNTRSILTQVIQSDTFLLIHPVSGTTVMIRRQNNITPLSTQQIPGNQVPTQQQRQVFGQQQQQPLGQRPTDLRGSGSYVLAVRGPDSLQVQEGAGMFKEGCLQPIHNGDIFPDQTCGLYCGPPTVPAAFQRACSYECSKANSVALPGTGLNQGLPGTGLNQGLPGQNQRTPPSFQHLEGIEQVLRRTDGMLAEAMRQRKEFLASPSQKTQQVGNGVATNGFGTPLGRSAGESMTRVQGRYVQILAFCLTFVAVGLWH